MRNFVLGLSLSACLSAFGWCDEYIHTNAEGCVQSGNYSPLEHGVKYSVDSILFGQTRDLPPEQRELKLKLMYVDAFLTDAENNSPRLTVGEEYFIANGIPVKYYHELVARGKDVAEHVASNKHWTSDLVGYRKELRELYTRFFKAHAATDITFEDFYRNVIIKEFRDSALVHGEWYDGPLPEIHELPVAPTPPSEISRFYGRYERDMAPEELAMKRKLDYVAVFCSKIVDNRTVLTVGEDYFRENGIPVEYLDQLKARIKHGEDYSDYVNIMELGKVADRTKAAERHRKRYAAFLEEYQKTGILYDEFWDKVYEAHCRGEKFPWED